VHTTNFDLFSMCAAYSTSSNSHDSPIVSFHERDITDLMGRYPLLSRAEVMLAVSNVGPIRVTVEHELQRLSGLKNPRI